MVYHFYWVVFMTEINYEGLKYVRSTASAVNCIVLEILLSGPKRMTDIVNDYNKMFRDACDASTTNTTVLSHIRYLAEVGFIAHLDLRLRAPYEITPLGKQVHEAMALASNTVIESIEQARARHISDANLVTLLDSMDEGERRNLLQRYQR